MKNLVLFLSMLFTQSCLEKDAVLPKAIPYTGNQLRMDGYYYQKAPYNDAIHDIYVMYANGVLITLGGSESTIEEMDKYVKRSVQDIWYEKNKYLWGVFFIDSNAIRINFLSRDYPHRCMIFEGAILKDTIFSITKYTYDGKEGARDRIYYFREFSPKPDSTNVYIK